MKMKVLGMALFILLALMIQPVCHHNAVADMGRIYANDAQVSEESLFRYHENHAFEKDMNADLSKTSPPAIGHAEEHQGNPWIFPMDEVIKELKERCGLKPEKGPCQAIYEKYYFDSESRKCRKFTWGGCDGVVPFEAEEDCRELCR